MGVESLKQSNAVHLSSRGLDDCLRSEPGLASFVFIVCDAWRCIRAKPSLCPGARIGELRLPYGHG